MQKWQWQINNVTFDNFICEDNTVVIDIFENVFFMIIPKNFPAVSMRKYTFVDKTQVKIISFQNYKN